MQRVCEFTDATAEVWQLNAAQERGDRAVLSRSARGQGEQGFAHRGSRSSKRTQCRALAQSTASLGFEPDNARAFRLCPGALTSVSQGRYQASSPTVHRPPPQPQPIPGKSLQAPGPATAVLQAHVHSGKLLPNPSLEATATGRALGPRRAASYHARRGPNALPLSAPQLKR